MFYPLPWPFIEIIALLKVHKRVVYTHCLQFLPPHKFGSLTSSPDFFSLPCLYHCAEIPLWATLAPWLHSSVLKHFALTTLSLERLLYSVPSTDLLSYASVRTQSPLAGLSSYPMPKDRCFSQLHLQFSFAPPILPLKLYFYQKFPS